MRPIAKRIVTFFVLLALVITTTGGELFSAFAVKASAEETSISLDETSIEEDLENLNFDYDKYFKDDTANPQVIHLMEYCFSDYIDTSEFYGVFLYIYNPCCKEIDFSNTNNVVNTATNYIDGKMSDYDNVELQYIDKTNDNMFYKLKILYSDSFFYNMRVYSAMNNGTRKYIIAGIQLFYGDSSSLAKDFEISTEYTFSGYAKGCGLEVNADSSLYCSWDGAETINLKVNQTCYRNKVYDDYTCRAVNTVYFALPPEYIEDYGNLQKIVAEWYEYKTKEIFVTSDKSAFEEISKHLRINIGEGRNSLHYRILWEETLKSGDFARIYYHFFKKAFNGKKETSEGYVDMFSSTTERLPGVTVSHQYTFGSVDEDNIVNDTWYAIAPIYWLFEINTPITSLDDYTLKSANLKDYMQYYTDLWGFDKLIAGRYSSDLFESTIDSDRSKLYGIDNGYLKVTIDADEKIELLQNRDSAFWQMWLGESKVEYSPILVLDGEHITKINSWNANNADDVAEFEKMYLVENNNTDSNTGNVLKDLQNIIASGNYPVLFRFAETDYYASEARFDDTSDYFDGIEDNEDIANVNGYVAQQTVFLSFDIISLTFRAENMKETVISVVADPIDVISDLIAPDSMKDDIEKEDWWQKIMALLLLILLVAFVWPIISPFLTLVITAVFSIIWNGVKAILGLIINVLTFPFRLIWRILFPK